MDELVTGLNNFYASMVSAKVLTKDSSKLDEEDDEPTAKQGRKHKGHEDKVKTPKKLKEGCPVVVPRLVTEDYKKLPPKERTELQTTGKLSGYTIVESTEHVGKYQLTKKDGSGTSGKPSKALRVKLDQEEDHDSVQETIDMLDAIEGKK